MSHWNLKRVTVPHDHADENEDIMALRGKTKIMEVHYDDEGHAWAFSDPCSRWDIIRHWKDWARAPVFTYPDNFTGKPPSVGGSSHVFTNVDDLIADLNLEEEE